MSIKIGSAIYKILSGSTSIHSLVQDKIYPLVLPELTVLPAIVYERNSNYDYTKDGYGIITAVVDVTILSIVYNDTINISQACFDVLNNYSGTINNIQIRKITLVNIQETFAENAFIQKLSFEVKSS